MLIVSYYTPDYAEHADRLRKSLRVFDYRYWIEAVEDSGSWVENCARKAAFVLKALRSQNDAVLWLDADAEIRRPIEKWFDFDDELDFAIYRDEKATNRKWKFRSGTVWFNNTPVAHDLAAEWVKFCESDPKRFDQESLYLAWGMIDVLPHWLPLTYCQRFDEPDGVPDPHIVHYQASRVARQRRQREKRGS